MKRTLSARDIERLENTSFANAFVPPMHHVDGLVSADNGCMGISGDQGCVSDNGVCTNVGICSNQHNCIDISNAGCTNTCGCTATATDPTCQVTKGTDAACLIVGPAILLDIVRRQA